MSVIVPAHDEAGYIGGCLDSLLAQDATAGAVEVIVAANGCVDDTAGVARGRAEAFGQRGWRLQVLDLPEPGKPGALNAGDAAAQGSLRMYLDADIRCDPDLLGQLRRALAVEAPHYATGRLAVAPARSWTSRRYGDFWCSLPFVRGGAVGAGCYAVNAAGRARWNRFPDLIADDSFTRLQFRPDERIEVPSRYHWPLVEGFSALVRVRRRQNAGMSELFTHHPELVAREGKAHLGPRDLLRLAVGMPISFLVYAGVSSAVRLRRGGTEWTRGR